MVENDALRPVLLSIEAHRSAGGEVLGVNIFWTCMIIGPSSP